MDVLCQEDAPLFLRVLEAMRLLEDDALGGGGSRGSGQVRFADLRLTWRGRDYYATGAAEKELGAGADMAAVQAAYNESGYAFLQQES
jgi:CRISPR-associated protein Csm3